MQEQEQGPIAYWHPRIVTVKSNVIYVSITKEENNSLRFGDVAKSEFTDPEYKPCWVNSEMAWRIARRHFAGVHHYLMKTIPVEMPSPPIKVVEVGYEYGSDEVRFAVCRLCAGEVMMKCLSEKCGCESRIEVKPLKRRTIRQK